MTTITKIALEVTIILNPFKLLDSEVRGKYCYKVFSDMAGTLNHHYLWAKVTAFKLTTACSSP